MEGFAKGFYSISEWVMRFMYVNILWIFFTLIGFVLLGLFPATTAMFSVARKWIMKEPQIPVFKTFWQTYKKEFLKSSVIGLIFTAFGCLLYSNIRIIEAITVPILKLLYIPNVILIVLFLLALLYIFPVMVHFNLGIKGVIKNAFILMMINPIQTFCMGVLTCFLVFIFHSFPDLIPFFSGSSIAFLLMWFSKNVFENVNKVEKKVVSRRLESLKES